MMPDERTYLISLRAVEGGLECLDHSPVPSLRDGAIVELHVPRSAFLDEGVPRAMDTPHITEIVGAGEKVLLGLNPSIAPLGLRKGGERGLSFAGYKAYAEVVLLEPLRLRTVRGRGTLERCRCEVQALRDKRLPWMAESLNHAFTMLSEHFEAHRTSHTGNVFERCLVKAPANSRPGWLRLRELR